MKKYSPFVLSLLFFVTGNSQAFDTSLYSVNVEYRKDLDKYFTNDMAWRGADGASSIDLENGNVLWLFSDSFICSDSSGLRKRSTIIRNSIAIQNGYDLKAAPVKFYWNNSKSKPRDFFYKAGKCWLWTGHGTMIKDKLLIFLMKVRSVKSGLGFEVFGWYAVLISNPAEEPSEWKMQYIQGAETYGTIAGSAAVLKDANYIYAYGAVEPATHEVYLLRWKLDEAYHGSLANPEWWFNGKWAERKTKEPAPESLFSGATEYSVHYDTLLKKYVQIQSFGFGEGKIGIRLSDSVQGKWTDPLMIYSPVYAGIKKPLLYAARAHPELDANGIYITYNVNSSDFGELIENQAIYFPKFILLRMVKKDVYQKR